jgi:hypothetical protein
LDPVRARRASEATAPAAPAAAREADGAPLPGAEGDRLRLSAGARLWEGNKRAARTAGGILGWMVRHPEQAVTGIGKAMFRLAFTPWKAAGDVAARFRQDPVDGVILGTGMLAGFAGLASLGLGLAAVAAAPLTAGASLAVLPALGTVASVTGMVGLGSLGASIVKNQVDVARARTGAELAEQSAELGQDLANAGLAVATWGVGKGLKAGVRRLSGQRGAAAKFHHDSVVSGNKLADRLGRPSNGVAEGGRATAGMTGEALRAEAAGRVEAAIARTPHGARGMKVQAIDGPSLAGVPEAGEVRLAYQGRAGRTVPKVLENGLRPSAEGNYGPGVYLGSSADVAVRYADDFFAQQRTGEAAGVFAVEMAPGKVFDWFKQKGEFHAWLDGRKDVPPDALQLLPTFAREKGYHSIFVRAVEGKGHDYWVVHDPARVALRQLHVIDPPPNVAILPNAGRAAVAVVPATAPDGREP